MFKNTSPSFSGYAQLNAIYPSQDDELYVSDEFYASLDFIHSYDDPFQWELKCLFNMNEFPILAQAEQYLAKGKTILLRFDAKDSDLKKPSEDTGVPESDFGLTPPFNVMLLNIYECYVEDVGTFYPDKREDIGFSHPKSYNFKRQIHADWSIENILFFQPRLTPQQACQVLDYIRINHDQTVEMSSVIKTASDTLFPDNSSEKS
ncbi:MAG: hypothetical protein K0R24_998 [Gammaproteobacteria bacterium]|nr:hypothetical protein [Gammaproteobacteria bacterium]